MSNVIIKDREFRLGKTRSEQAENLRKEGWGIGLPSEEHLDKCKFLEKRGGVRFPRGADIERIK